MPGLVKWLVSIYVDNDDRRYVKTTLRAIAGLAVFHLSLVTTARADWTLSSEFSKVFTIPADFQNSTVLSVAVGSLGQVVASKGFNLTTVPFDGSTSVSTNLSFTSGGFLVDKVRFDDALRINLLTSNAHGSGGVWRESGGTYSPYLEFGLGQNVPRSFSFGSSGNFIVAGTYGSIDANGWIRTYDAGGSSTINIDTDQAPAGVDIDGSGTAYMSGFNGKLYEVTGSGPSFVSKLSSHWTGAGTGYVQSFAIDGNGDWYFGVNLGQRFGINSGAILRLSPTNVIDVFALGVGDLPADLAFDDQNNLYVASFNPYSGSSVYRFTGDFSGPISGAPEPVSTPESGSLILLLAGTTGMIAYSWFRRIHIRRQNSH